MISPQPTVLGPGGGPLPHGASRIAQPKSSSVVVRFPSGGLPPACMYEGGSALRICVVFGGATVAAIDAPAAVTAFDSSWKVAAGSAAAEVTEEVSVTAAAVVGSAARP